MYHSIGLFSSRRIAVGEELTLDYQWDKNELTIEEDVPCLCGSIKCRGYLMRAKKVRKRESKAAKNQRLAAGLDKSSKSPCSDAQPASSAKDADATSERPPASDSVADQGDKAAAH